MPDSDKQVDDDQRDPWEERRAQQKKQNLNLLRTLVVTAGLPWLVYILLRPHVNSDAEALAIGGAIPAAWIIGRLVVKHKLDWIPFRFEQFAGTYRDEARNLKLDQGVVARECH